MVQILIKSLDFRGYLLTFRAKNIKKCWPLNSKNNAEALLKQIQNHFEIVWSTIFSTAKMDKKQPLKY